MMDGKCTCNWGAGIISLILMSLGLFILVQGFVIQFNSSNLAYITLVWYFVGFALMVGGKISKHKAMGSCSMHCGPKMSMSSSGSMPTTKVTSVKKRRRK